MKLKGIVAIVVFVLFVNCKKDPPEVIVEEEKAHTISGAITTPGGTALQGVLVTFDDRVDRYEVTTNAAGQYSFEKTGNRSVDLYFDGKPLRYLNMRDRGLDFGGFDRTFDKMLVPWEIEEIDFLTTFFIDNPEKEYSLVKYNFDQLKMQPSDFQNLIGSVHMNNYETTFTSPQAVEETEVMVSFYSMPENTGYSIDNHDEVTYSDVLSWKKILTISTTTTPIGVLEPVMVNLASAFANHPDYDHSGTIIMVSDEINATLGVTSDVDLLEIRLPYGDDYEL